jgi:hypothetical protein
MPNSLINNFQDNLRKNPKKFELKKVKIILPNLSKSNIIVNNDKINKGENSISIKKNESIYKTILNSSTDRNKIKFNKKLNLNKSISFPSLKNKNNLLNDKKINDYSSKNIFDFSNRNLSKSYNKNNLLNNNIHPNRQLIKSNLLNTYIRLEKPNSYRGKYIDFRINKNSDISKNNKDMTTSTLKISKIKLNDTISNKKIYKKLNTSLSCKNSGSKSFFRPDSTIISIPKHSHFFKLSQKDSISARRIYKHYLKKSQGEFTQPIKNYNRFFEDKSQTFLEKLSRIYCENKNFLAIVKELKDNNKIAYKKDFNIEEYQSTIMELMDQRVSQKYLLDLQNDYRALNKKLYGIIEPKGRFTILAEKLRYNLPSYLLEKMKKLDEDSIISKMKYYNQFKSFKKGNKLKCRFNDDSGGRSDGSGKMNKKKNINANKES